MVLKIDNYHINQNYTQYEIQLKFIDFLQKELKSDDIELFEISVNDMPESTQKRFNNIEKMNFVNY